MKSRVNNKSLPGYKNYGGRGIKICASWYDFAIFYRDMGDPPLGMTLERIANNEDYQPNNCYWAPRIHQSRNRRYCRRISYRGRTQLLTDWSRELSIHRMTLSRRLETMSVEDAFEKPLRRHRRVALK